MSAEVQRWWLFLAAVSALNLLAWALTAARLWQQRALLDAETFRARRLQALLSAGYVLGCAFRSAYPVQDVPRLCLFDSPLASVAIGRAVATVAELCFALQGALLLRELGRLAHSRAGAASAYLLFALIVVAEGFSWTAVLRGWNLGHVVEESLWTAAATMMSVAMAIGARRSSSAALRRLLLAGCAIGLAYIGFMLLVDVPMYWQRWQADETAGHLYRGLLDGLLDAIQRCNVSGLWQHWHSEVPWMSLYFSVAVWLSIALIQLPPLRQRVRGGRRQPSRR